MSNQDLRLTAAQKPALGGNTQGPAEAPKAFARDPGVLTAGVKAHPQRVHGALADFDFVYPETPELEGLDDLLKGGGYNAPVLPI